ncbi:MAG: epoxyqueuosine reductase [Victivallales bacterium]|nr:epoxyqueuosine reductase [Victivallales bacterium]
MDCINYLIEQKKSLGIAAVAVKRLDQVFCAGFTKDFDLHYGRAGVQLPDYVIRTLKLRRDPLAFFPWARSVVMAAIPFSIIPSAKNFMPKPSSSEYSGYVPGYAARLDYHVFARDILGSLAMGLVKNCSAGGAKYEICSDASPVAERALAASSGLGRIGRNFCVLTQHHGSACLIGEIFTDLELPELEEPRFKPPCRGCDVCVNACTSGALSSPRNFNMARCRSYISMEKRGPLSHNETSILGSWVFGCDECTSCCHPGSMPEKIPVDLEWILMRPAAEVRECIKDTVISHTGVTLLRRNAVGVLANRKSTTQINLIREFASVTSSSMLKTFAESVLREIQP